MAQIGQELDVSVDLENLQAAEKAVIARDGERKAVTDKLQAELQRKSSPRDLVCHNGSGGTAASPRIERCRLDRQRYAVVHRSERLVATPHNLSQPNRRMRRLSSRHAR